MVSIGVGKRTDDFERTERVIVILKPLAFLLLCSFLPQLMAAEESSLRLEISGLTGAEGRLYVAIYDSADTWLGDAAFVSRTLDIAETTEGEMVVADINLPAGDYAISVFYDVNDNGELDTNFIGIPKEPVALSNNAKPRFGPPKYLDAVFDLTAAGLTQQIAIKKM